MSKNSILTLSKIISSEIDGKSTIGEIDFAIDEIEKLLHTENIRKNLTKKELSKKNSESCIHVFDLNDYLEQIENNILKLENFLEILSGKKRLMEFNTRKPFSLKNEITF